METAEEGAAPIPAPRDGAESEGGASPGPRHRETPDIRRSDEGPPRRGRGEYLPREVRIRLFDEVIGLRAKGLSYNKIIKEIRDRYGIRLNKSHVSEWVRGIHSPYNGQYIPSVDFLKPSEELAYIIGVVLGDGFAIKVKRGPSDYHYIIGLQVKDRGFANEFARCLSKVLGRSPKKPTYIKSIKHYVVRVESKTLYELLKKPIELDRLKPYIEHSRKCMAAFIRGFVDAEGCVAKDGFIRIFNTNLRFLVYLKDLLHRLGIESTEPRLSRRSGKTIYWRGKRIMMKKDCYSLYIRTSGYLRFYKTINFTIERKRVRLEEYLRRQSLTPPPLFPSTF